MRIIDQIVDQLQQQAMAGVFRGDDDMPYARACTMDIALSDEKGVRFMFMRHVEDGRHFFNLSLSFRLYQANKPSRFDHRFARKAVPVVFGSRVVSILVTPPQTKDGKYWSVWHFRLFTDDKWAPLGYTPPNTLGAEPAFSWDEYSRAVFA